MENKEKTYDYKELELKIGVEIHQQLDTHKLFCKCPSLLRAEEPDFIVKRKIYAVAGETGKIDAAAAYEQSRKREFVYEGYSDTTCEIEMDESPPLYVNKEALKIALQVAFLLNAKPLRAMQVMRKTVVDGSNTSGFQRTIMIATNGYLVINNKKIGISAICLEEDAARIIKQDENNVFYRLDRLGIPLIEISTNPDINNPEEAKEAASKIGEILRACKVKRGIGTIRQDVNINIKSHPRVEIKGFQDIRVMPKTILNEIERQKNNTNKQAEVRRANPDATTTFLRPIPSAERMYPETDLPLIRVSEEEIKEIKNNLPELKESITARLEEKIKNPEIINELIRQNKVEMFEELSEIYDENVIAKVITMIPKSIEAHHKISTNKITKNVFESIFKALRDKKISEGAVEQILTDFCKGEDLEKLISQRKPVSEEDIEAEIKEIVEKNRQLSFNAVMGLAMAKLKGKADGKKIAELVKKLLSI